MAIERTNRQILINPHTSGTTAPAGKLNLGEIAVQHDSLSGASLWIETVANSESEETLVQFINASAVNYAIEQAQTDIQTKIDAINNQVGLPHSAGTFSGAVVWDAIEGVYSSMTQFSAGTIQLSADTHNAIAQLSAGTMQLSADTDAAIVALSGNIITVIEENERTTAAALNELNSSLTELSAATLDIDDKVDALSAGTLAKFDALDYTGVTPDGRAIVNVTEENGVITAVQGNISANTVYIEDAGSNFSGDTVEAALAELAGKVSANEIKSEDHSINITPDNGKTDISVNIKSGDHVLASTGDGLYTDIKISGVTPSGTNVKEEFILKATDGSQLGESIKIYKDSSLYSVYLGHVDDAITSSSDPTVVPGTGDTALCFIYLKADGTYELVAVNVESFLQESEFKSGVTVDNGSHIVHGVVDPTSESFLTVGGDGFKLAGVQNAIDLAKASATTVVAEGTDEGSNLSIGETTGTDGHKIYTINLADVASSGALVTEITNRISADTALQNEIDAIEAAIDLNADGTYKAKSGTHYLDDAQSVEGEIAALDAALFSVSGKVNAVSVTEGSSVENFVSLSVTPDNGTPGTTAVTIDDTALKTKIDNIESAITVEAEARENADDELRGTETGSTSAETSIWGVKKYVDGKITTIVEDVTADEVLIHASSAGTADGETFNISATTKLQTAVALAETSVQEVGFAAVATKNSTVYGSNAGAEIVDGSNGGKKINLDLSLLKIDCGEY